MKPDFSDECSGTCVCLYVWKRDTQVESGKSCQTDNFLKYFFSVRVSSVEVSDASCKTHFVAACVFSVSIHLFFCI